MNFILDKNRIYNNSNSAIYRWTDYKGEVHYHPMYLKKQLIQQDKINSRNAKINKIKEKIC
jgi:hypothetical protein